MPKWEYCKIVRTLDEQPHLIFLGPSKKESRIESLGLPDSRAGDVDAINFALARLGLDGWELVNNTQALVLAIRVIREHYAEFCAKER